MESKIFKDSRDATLSEFQTRYNTLRTQYSSALMSAIQERDSDKQQELIQEILAVNEEMTAEVRGILEVLNKGTKSYNTTIIDNLTQDLINYQKQNLEIKESKDKVMTLKIIQSSSKEKIETANQLYMFYLIALIGLIFVVGYLAIRTPGYFTLPSITPTTLPVLR
jgi:hypothetical protein